ncbi:MAG: DUF1320 domain-containing protein [Nitrospiraceae bacterium]|nr:DUF1320 domain-containing protein [Nitrospiraceae bacterium]
MAYCTHSDIAKTAPEEDLIALTDDEKLGVANEERITGAIERADSLIDAYCRQAYGVPFTPVPELIKSLSADIALYNLYTRKVDAVPEARSQRYRDALSVLDAIAKGTMPLPLAGNGGPESSAAEKVFTDEGLGGY